MIKYLVVVAAVASAVIAFQCTKRQASGYQYQTSAEGWDKCDSNGLACCYYINGTVIIYSHGYDAGQYNPNTHCEYVIDLDSECDIVICATMDFSMNGNDMVSIRTLDTNIKWAGQNQPSSVRVGGNKATIAFNSGPDVPADGSKWSLGIVCVPKTEYKPVCEVCEDIENIQSNGPNGDSILKGLA